MDYTRKFPITRSLKRWSEGLCQNKFWSSRNYSGLSDRLGKKAREVAIGPDRKYLIKHLPLINFKAKVYNTGNIHHMYDLNYILTYIFKSSFKFCFRCVTLDTIIFFFTIHINNVYRIPNLMPGYLFRILMTYNSTT